MESDIHTDSHSDYSAHLQVLQYPKWLLKFVCISAKACQLLLHCKSFATTVQNCASISNGKVKQKFCLTMRYHRIHLWNRVRGPEGSVTYSLPKSDLWSHSVRARIQTIPSGVGVSTTGFFHQRISQMAVRTSVEKQLDHRVQLLLEGGPYQYF